MNTEIVPGRYQHYKGNFYDVIGITIHSETLERLVLYRALYSSKEFGEDTLWVRPLSMFTEDVIVEGKTVPRFKKIHTD